MKIAAVILMTLGFLLMFFGNAFKVMHWPYHAFLIVAGIVVEAIGVILLVTEFARNKW